MSNKLAVITNGNQLAISEGSALATALAYDSSQDEGESVALDLGGDESFDHYGIRPETPRLKFDGKSGRFVEPGQDPRDGKSEIFGVILARQAGKVFFGPDLTKENVARYVKGVGFDVLLNDEKISWFCKNSNAAIGTLASLNPKLNEAQREEALKLKIGGATKLGCRACPANAWAKIPNADGTETNIRLCKDAENLYLLRNDEEEPQTLNVIASTSVQSIQEYMKKAYFKGVPEPPLVWYVKMAGEGVYPGGVKGKKGPDYYQMTIERIQKFPVAEQKQLAAVYRANVKLFRSSLENADYDESAGFEVSQVVDQDSADASAVLEEI